MPPCEAKLVSKMTELLSSLEGVEPALRDSTKKARGRLQKEWTNFKEGYIYFFIRIIPCNVNYHKSRHSFHCIKFNLGIIIISQVPKESMECINEINYMHISNISLHISNILRLKSSFFLKPLEIATISTRSVKWNSST